MPHEHDKYDKSVNSDRKEDSNTIMHGLTLKKRSA